MTHKKLLRDYPESKSEYIYGSAARERRANNPETLPRYAKLARKALCHYAKDHYDPHTTDLLHEIYIRQLIHTFIETKVIYKLEGYDWEYIDNFLKKVIGESLEIDIPYNAKRVEQGIRTELRVNHFHSGNTTIN